MTTPIVNLSVYNLDWEKQFEYERKRIVFKEAMKEACIWLNLKCLRKLISSS